MTSMIKYAVTAAPMGSFSARVFCLIANLLPLGATNKCFVSIYTIKLRKRQPKMQNKFFVFYGANMDDNSAVSV